MCTLGASKAYYRCPGAEPFFGFSTEELAGGGAVVSGTLWEVDIPPGAVLVAVPAGEGFPAAPAAAAAGSDTGDVVTPEETLGPDGFFSDDSLLEETPEVEL